jgi:hypothetical protein
MRDLCSTPTYLYQEPELRLILHAIQFHNDEPQTYHPDGLQWGNAYVAVDIPLPPGIERASVGGPPQPFSEKAGESRRQLQPNRVQTTPNEHREALVIPYSVLVPRNNGNVPALIVGNLNIPNIVVAPTTPGGLDQLHLFLGWHISCLDHS